MPRLEESKPLPLIFDPDGEAIVNKIYWMGQNIRNGEYSYTDKQMGNYFIDIQYHVWKHNGYVTDKVKEILRKVDDLNRHQLVDELNDLLGMLEKISE